MENKTQKTGLTFYFPYVLPFAIFIVLTSVGNQFVNGPYIIYPIKTIITAFLLLYYWKNYDEIKFNFSFIPVIVGIIVFVIWVLPEKMGWNYPMLGHSSFDPYRFNNAGLSYFLIFFRLTGASLVVPVFEELFWRYFLLRYIINSDFKSVPLGKFTWGSFILTTLLFASEHNEWLVGIIAGIVYNSLLYYRKDIF